MKLISINKLIGLVLLISFIISRIFDLPTFISSIFAFLWFLYVPYTIGWLFLKIPLKKFKKLDLGINSIEIVGSIIKWFLGVIVITIALLLLFIIQINIANILGSIFLFISVAAQFLVKSKLDLSLNKNHVMIILSVIIIGISFGYYVRSFSPYPLSPGIDVFNHMFVIKSILDNSPFNSPLVYLPTFDIIIALASSPFQADLNSIFWFGSIFITIFFSLSCYILLYYLLRNNIQSIFGTIIAVSLTEMGFATNLQFFFPASFLMSIFPLMFFVMDRLWKEKIQNNIIVNVTLTIIIYIFLISIHSYIGFIMSLVLTLFIFSYYYVAKRDKLFLILRIATIIFASIILLYYLGYITFQFQLDFIKSNQFESYHLYNTFTKSRILEDWYTKEILLLSIIGFILLSFYKNKNIVILNFIGVIIILTYFQQISDIHRIMPLERSILALAAVTTITLPLIVILQKFKFPSQLVVGIKKMLSNIFTKHKNGNNTRILRKIKSNILHNKLGIFHTYRKSSKILLLYVMVIFILLFPTLLQPLEVYINTYLSKGYDFTNYTYDELDASIWINNNIPKNYKIYSDPSTVIEMRGLSYRMNIEGIGWNTTTAFAVKSVLLSENSTYAYQNIMTNHGKDVAIVITPRTSEWIGDNVFFLQSPIKEFKFFDGIEKFFDEKYFKLEYYNDSVMIFTLK